MKAYTPNPVDTHHIQLDDSLTLLMERLAENAHDIWAQKRINEGWQWGENRDDQKKKHPCLVPYDDLPESEKAYDREMAMQVLKMIIALGYEIKK